MIYDRYLIPSLRYHLSVHNIHQTHIDQLDMIANNIRKVDGFTNSWLYQIVNFPSMHNKYQQAGAELCQAQIKLGLAWVILFHRAIYHLVILALYKMSYTFPRNCTVESCEGGMCNHF